MWRMLFYCGTQTISKCRSTTFFGRTNKPQDKLYDYNPKAFDNEKMQQFMEMCFDPKSPANAKLKEAVLKLLREEQK